MMDYKIDTDPFWNDFNMRWDFSESSEEGGIYEIPEDEDEDDEEQNIVYPLNVCTRFVPYDDPLQGTFNVTPGSERYALNGIGFPAYTASGHPDRIPGIYPQGANNYLGNNRYHPRIASDSVGADIKTNSSQTEVKLFETVTTVDFWQVIVVLNGYTTHTNVFVEGLKISIYQDDTKVLDVMDVDGNTTFDVVSPSPEGALFIHFKRFDGLPLWNGNNVRVSFTNSTGFAEVIVPDSDTWNGPDCAGNWQIQEVFTDGALTGCRDAQDRRLMIKDVPPIFSIGEAEGNFPTSQSIAVRNLIAPFQDDLNEFRVFVGRDGNGQTTTTRYYPFVPPGDTCQPLQYRLRVRQGWEKWKPTYNVWVRLDFYLEDQTTSLYDFTYKIGPGRDAWADANGYTYDRPWTDPGKHTWFTDWDIYAQGVVIGDAYNGKPRRIRVEYTLTAEDPADQATLENDPDVRWEEERFTTLLPESTTFNLEKTPGLHTELPPEVVLTSDRNLSVDIAPYWAGITANEFFFSQVVDGTTTPQWPVNPAISDFWFPGYVCAGKARLSPSYPVSSYYNSPTAAFDRTPERTDKPYEARGVAGNYAFLFYKFWMNPS